MQTSSQVPIPSRPDPMTDIQILTERDLRARVPLDLPALDVVQDGFVRLAHGQVEMPPVLSMAIAPHNGELDVKTAYVQGLPTFAVKLSPGFFDNPARGLPSTSGLMVVLSAETGQVRAVLLDNGYLTDLRTAAAGGVAVRCLARADAARVAILGAGLQARLQLRALALVRPIRHVAIWARDTAKAQKMAQDMQAELGLPVVVTDAESAVTQADIIVTTTPARAPILRADWLRPGQHITAMGSDQHGKRELDPACLARALYVPDRLSQTRLMGEAQGVALPDATPELGAILAGQAPGRTGPDQITIADLTGTGVQDTVIATHALRMFTKENQNA
jgi:ornithine cyclodeaminase